MQVGILRLTLHLPENHSLKEKRRAVKSLLEKVHRRFNVAAVEVGDHERWQVASLAIGCISTEAPHAQQVLAAALAFIQHERPDLPLLDYETELIAL